MSTARKADSSKGASLVPPGGVLRLVKRLTVLFRDHVDEALRPLKVTTAQLMMMAALAEEPDAARSGAQISRYCRVTPQSTQVLLADAERRGWIRRTPHPENARVLLASLTPEGKRLFARARTVARRLEKRMLRTLTAEEVSHLERSLERLIANLE